MVAIRKELTWAAGDSRSYQFPASGDECVVWTVADDRLWLDGSTIALQVFRGS